MRGSTHTRTRGLRLQWVPCSLLGVVALLLWSSSPALTLAQRPFQIYDPFYQDETARRQFFDRYAFTTELSYRPEGLLNNPVNEPGSPIAESPFGLSFKLDYQLAKRFDVGVIIDAAGGPTGRNVSASWLTFKYYRTVDHTDYAFRLAVDPSSDGRSGFPQMDFAFLYRSWLSPTFSSDFAIGVRRVRLGFNYRDDGRGTDPPPPASPETPFGLARAVGLELHMMWNHNAHIGFAGSNLFLTFLGQGGTYDLVDLGEVDGGGNPSGPDEEAEARSAVAYRGGVVWVLTGLELFRPSYRIAPYLGIPLLQWTPADPPQGGAWPQHTMRIGLRFTLR